MSPWALKPITSASLTLYGTRVNLLVDTGLPVWYNLGMKGKQTMTIYTISTQSDLRNEFRRSETIGSCYVRGDAIRKCAEQIIGLAKSREDISRLLFCDENHPDIPQKPLEHEDVFEYIMDEIGGQGGYDMYSDWIGSIGFYVDENELS